MVFPFDENFAEYIENEVPEAQALSDYLPRTISDEIELDNTPQLVSLYLTQAQYLKIMSSLFTGAWYVYPDEWLEIMASFWQGITKMNCDYVANCIDTSDAVALALANWASNNGGSIGAGTPNTVASNANNDNLLPVGYTCSNDNLFGMCMEIVEMAHQNTVEVFQAIDANQGNTLDLINSILDNIPVVELLGIVTEVVAWVADDISTEYNAAWSLTIQQNLACDLFCLVKDDCNLSWDDIWEVYRDASNILTPITDDADSWFEAIIDTVLGTDKQVAALGSMLGLVAMRFGGQFAFWVAGIRTMKQTIALAANASDPDWNILCTSCSPTIEWELLNGVDNGGGSYTSVYVDSPPNPYDYRLELCINDTMPNHPNSEPNALITINSFTGGGASVLWRIGNAGCGTFVGQNYVYNSTTAPVVSYCGRTIIIVSYAPITVSMTLATTPC